MKNHIVALWTAIVVLAACSLFAVIQGVQVRNHQNDSLHSIFCYINTQEQTAKSRTAAEKAAQAKEIERLLRVGNLKPCK